MLDCEVLFPALKHAYVLLTHTLAASPPPKGNHAPEP